MQSALTNEDYRVLRLCYQRGGKLMPAELTVKWRAYHDRPGAARVKLNNLVRAGTGQWARTKEHPCGQFILDKSWVQYFDREKSDAFWGNVMVAGGIIVGAFVVAALTSVSGGAAGAAAGGIISAAGKRAIK